MGKCFKVCPRGKGDDVVGPDKIRTFLDIFIVKAIRAPGWAKVSTPAELQILIAFTIESGKPYAYFIRSTFIFLLEQSLFINIPYRTRLQSLSAGEPKMEKKVPGTFRFCSLSLPSRNTLHTDQAAFASPFKNSPNNDSCTNFTQVECTKNKNTKALEVRNVEGA